MEPYRHIGPRKTADNHWEFTVWAPLVRHLQVEFPALGRSLPLEKDAEGYFGGLSPDTSAGTDYLLVLDGNRRLPDPASRYQAETVHGPSRLVDSHYPWDDRQWTGLPLESYVIYELHVGTFSPEGTFEGVRRRLDHLVELGITAIELMPLAQFPGRKNWGYDGVLPFAVQNSYGGPDDLRRLVDSCHEVGLAVILDVVYNHMGPEGNYLNLFGPYFTDRHHTPWGDALNFDGAGSDGVRNYFLQNALYWLDEFHMDALRLDAVHAIMDLSPRHFLEELGEKVRRLSESRGRAIHLIAESDLNDPRIVYPQERGGDGMDAVWADDFHHTVHALVTGETTGYYADYGKVEQLVEIYRKGFLFTGQFSTFRGKRHGRTPEGVAPSVFCVCTQNHDQIGNRKNGERLTKLVSPVQERLAAAALLLSPFTPLIFMGQEYGETAPFLYFVDHGDPELVKAVREGRKKEFHGFNWEDEPPDPVADATFDRSRLKWELLEKDEHRKHLDYYKRLISLRRFLGLERLTDCLQAHQQGNLVVLDYSNVRAGLRALLNFSDEMVDAGRWKPGEQYHEEFSSIQPETRDFSKEFQVQPWEAIVFSTKGRS